MHEVGRLFKRMILGTDTLKVKASAEQVSLAFTVYSTGGTGVIDGSGVEVIVLVGVRVKVGVVVAVGIWVGSTTLPAERKVKNTADAPMTTNKANNPSAAGKVKVSSGIRLP